MHDSVHNWFGRVAARDEFAGKLVVEAGAYDVNGGLRSAIEKFGPAQYVGTDMRSGPGVDAVIDAPDLAAHFADIDVVICTEMLEHCADWRGAITALKSILAPGGMLYLTTRGPGYPKHDFPHDYWRFSVAVMAEIFADFTIITCEPDSDPNSPGVFVKARKRLPGPLVDLMTIAAEPVS